MAQEFSLDEARAALAAARPPLARLQQVQRRLQEVRAALQALGRRHLNDGVVGERDVHTLRAEQRRLGEQAQQLVTEIRTLGIELKSITEGLLDFPTHVEGAPAYWCWRSGEADIGWWHPRSTGFAGRRPIA